MTKIDKYILAQLIGPFAFFCLIFSGILWLNQALGIVAIVTENGQPASIFIELSVLLIPKVLIAAIPISGFAAAVYLTNRMYGEAELVVMMSAGRSYFQLAKPFLVFGAFCFTLLFVVVHFLTPIAQSKLAQRQDEIKREFITQIVQPGQFISAQDKFTFFFGFKDNNGSLKDVLIEEQESPVSTTTYIANTGQIVTEDGKTTLVLGAGSIQRNNTASGNFSLVQFDTLAFDMTQMGENFEPHVSGYTEYTSPRLRQAIQDLPQNHARLGRATSLYHGRHVQTLLALLFPVLGLAALLVGGYRRSGFTLRIVVGVLLMATLDSLRGAAKSWVRDAPELWMSQYLTIGLCVLLIAVMLWLASKNLKQLNPFSKGATL